MDPIFYIYKFVQKATERACKNDDYRKYVEYLLYSFDPETESEPNAERLMEMLERGVLSSEEMESRGLARFVPLHNSLPGSDLARIQYWKNKNLKPSKQNKHITKTRILVLKCYFGKVGTLNEVNSVNGFHDSSPQYDSAVRVSPTDPRQKVYYIFDHAFILPEYFVDIQYLSESKFKVHQRTIYDKLKTTGTTDSIKR